MQMMGMLLLFAASVAIVFHLRSDEKRYMQALRCAVAVVRHTGRKIRLYGTPVEEILSDFDDAFGILPAGMGDAGGFADALVLICRLLRGQEGKVFSEFLDKLGREYREEAIKLCEYTQSCLEERRIQVEAEHPSRMRLYTALPILSAVSIFVLFL